MTKTTLALFRASMVAVAVAVCLSNLSGAAGIKYSIECGVFLLYIGTLMMASPGLVPAALAFGPTLAGLRHLSISAAEPFVTRFAESWGGLFVSTLATICLVIGVGINVFGPRCPKDYGVLFLGAALFDVCLFQYQFGQEQSPFQLANVGPGAYLFAAVAFVLRSNER